MYSAEIVVGEMQGISSLQVLPFLAEAIVNLVNRRDVSLGHSAESNFLVQALFTDYFRHWFSRERQPSIRSTYGVWSQ